LVGPLSSNHSADAIPGWWFLTNFSSANDKRSIAIALHRYSCRFTTAQMGVLADLYMSAFNHLGALVLVRDHRTWLLV
jgi:hypothetical protein